METSNSQNTSIQGTVGSNAECLFWPASANERMIQENIKKIPKGTQTTLMPPLSYSKIPRSSSECKTNALTETPNDSVLNASSYESFSVDESKYDSFDDSLDEEAHQSPQKINASNFLSEQVNVTVRKVRDRQKIKGSYLCDSLEDICSLVSNAEHISNSDEMEYISNILEKHGICEDSLRNDICYENKNVSLNEQNFDDDSLAILEIEKPFDDSLEDVDVVSCVDSLMILGNSIGDSEVMIDKLISENCGTRNHLETSVQIIYENAPISSDESFRTAENFNSNKNSLSLSDCAMSRDSLEEIHDIPEIASSEKSSNIPLKSTCDMNEPGEKLASLEDFNDNVLEREEKQTSSELSPLSQNRVSTVESERTSSVVNSCYFYDTFCMDDSMQLPPGFDNKESIDKGIGSKFLNEDSLELVSKTTEKLMESTNECSTSLTSLNDMDKETTENVDISTNECDKNADTANVACITPKEEGSQTAVMSTSDVLNKNLPKLEGNEIKDCKLSSVLAQAENVPSTSVPVFESECSLNDTSKCSDTGSVPGSTYPSPQVSLNTKRDELKIQLMEIGFSNSGHSSKLLEPSENIPKTSNDSLSSPIKGSPSNIPTCVTVSPSLDELAKHNATATKCTHKHESVKHKPDQMNLKLHIELAINKNCDVNIVSVSSMEKEVQNKGNKPLEKSYLPQDEARVFASNNQTDQLKTVDSKNEFGVLEKIVTEACKKIPTLPKISEDESSYGNHQKLISPNKICIDTASNIHDAQLLKALDLHDSSFNYYSEEHIQSRDSIMPLNLCVRDLSPTKRNDIFESKENIPCFVKCKKSPTDSKGTCLNSKNKPFVINRDCKKTNGKPCMITKIPIRKADSPLSIPVTQKLIKQDIKSSSCSKQIKAPIVKSTSIDSIGKLDEISRKHHFCMVRNSICRVPKSLERPSAKKFPNIESPIAKYIGNNKINLPLKTTHRYDGNFISTLPSRSTPKTTNNECAATPEVTVGKKCIRRLKS